MKHITDRDIMEARAVLMREIEAGRVTIPEDESDRESRCRENWRKEAKIGRVKTKSQLWRRPSRNPMLPGEIPLKQYVEQKAKEAGITRGSMFCRLIDSNYKGVELRRVNARVIFVKTQPQTEK